VRHGNDILSLKREICILFVAAMRLINFFHRVISVIYSCTGNVLLLSFVPSHASTLNKTQPAEEIKNVNIEKR